jgi:hypothetical protein
MPTKPGHPGDEVWSAPESGTVRDETSGNQPACCDGRPAPPPHEQTSKRRAAKSADDESYVAGEER